MDSRLLQKDSCDISDDDEEEFYSIRTRQRAAAKQTKRKDVSTRQIRNEIEPLLGENGLGLTADEFKALPDSERKQLMEAVLQSKEEYNKQRNKLKSEQSDGLTKTSGNKTTVNSMMPVKLGCSIALPVVIIDPAIPQNRSLVPSLNTFKLKRLSAVAAEGKIHTETVECKTDEDCFAVARVAELINRDEYSYIDAEKFKLSAGRQEVGETYSAEKNEDLDLQKITHPQDCLVVHKSNSPDSLMRGNRVQPRRRSGEMVSSEKETSNGYLLVTNDDNRHTSIVDVPAALRKAEMIEKNDLGCPGSSTAFQLIRKYHIQATDLRPLFKRKGLNLQTRARLIYDYYTECEISHYKSFCEINSRTQWGKPVAIAVDKGRASTRNRRLWQVITEAEEMNDRSPHKNENQALDSLVHSTCDIESKDVNNRMVLLPHSDFVMQFPSTTVTRKLLDVSVVLDKQCSREDIETRLRRSRQTKIGGGLAEEEGSKISRRKMPASDNENDPDFTPEKKNKRIRVDNERTKKSEKLKKRRLDVVKGKDKHLRTIKGQMAVCSKASEMNKESSDEYDEEVQESIKLPNSWQNVSKCQIAAIPRTNANNSSPRSSSSSEDLHESKLTVCSEMEENTSVKDALKNSCPVNLGVLNECQIDAELEDVSSSSPVLLGRNSSVKDDKKPHIFPVFQKLVRPCLREDEIFTDARDIPSTSKNANSTKNEDNEEYLSGYSSEGDDSNLDKSTKKRKKSRDQHPAFAKTYQRKRNKNVSEQQTIMSFATPSFKIPKVTRMCPMCQKDFSVSSLEEHVQQCIQMDDEKKTIR